ncbi:glycosyltransferase family 4 protein [Arcticibacter sp.]|uniref:glycosyltransferase family 4 protein n=1 Tax=Arcticibacter sp. TaxID=1872630 RepID=UPI00388D0A77
MSKRILFVTPALSKAGAETQMVKLASFLKSAGFDIAIISLLPQNDYTIDLTAADIKVFYLKSWKANPFSNLKELNQKVKAFNPDITIAFMFIGIIFARLLKLRFKFKLISSIRAAEIPGKWYVPFKLSLVLDDVVVFNAESSRLRFEQLSLVKKGGVVINNAITIPSFTEQSERVKDDVFEWICVAHFRSEKDYPTLFKAVSIIKDRDFRLIVVGHLFNQTWPLQMLQDLHIEDKVQLLGFRSDTGSCLYHADAFVVSSFTESMPNAILEAMANKKIVIGPDVGGVKSLIESAKSGLSFQQGNVDELARKMSEVMRMDAEERELFGTRGRNFVKDNFAESIVMDQWLKVINKQLSLKTLPKMEIIPS